MRYLSLILVFCLALPLFAEEGQEKDKDKDPDDHPEEMGRTYYDDGETVKEVYSYKEVQRFNPDEPQEGVQIEEVKNGIYFHYHENGELKIMGNYHDGEKEGEFTHFNEEGEEIKVIIYEEGEKVEEIEK